MLIAGKQNSINLSKTKVVNLYAKRGDTFNYPFIAKQPLVGVYIVDTETQYLLDVNGNIIYDSNGQPIIVKETQQILSKLTGTVIQSFIKKDKKSKNIIKIFNVNVNIESNSIILSLPAKETLIPAGKYYYDVELYDIENDTNTTILEGTITFSQDVTDFIDLSKDNNIFSFTNQISYSDISRLNINLSLSNFISYLEIFKKVVNSSLQNIIDYTIIPFQGLVDNLLLETKVNYNIYEIPFVKIVSNLSGNASKTTDLFNVSDNVLSTQIFYKIF